ncbi:MAG: ABC transporter permease [Proteobacteria bacterium]|nr:ABC transporter permease [Pseudomonadota bacterium]MBS0216719.1 ABC transporter permease [Pseudomonadota bacterium]
MSQVNPIAEVWGHRQLLLRMTQRDINSKYYGSAFGLLWSMATPAVLLAAYWLVLGRLLKASWPHVSNAQYPLLLFIGIVLHVFFSEVMGRASALIESHRTYVKKVVFPLGILSSMTILTASFHLAISLAIVFFAQIVLGLGVPGTWVALPLVLLPLGMMILGLSWTISALCVYVRDLQQVIPLLLTVSMFVSPIFFPIDSLPQHIRILFMLNPISFPVEAVRGLVLFGTMPDWTLWGMYTLASIAVLLFGAWWFGFTKRGFPDVL